MNLFTVVSLICMRFNAHMRRPVISLFALAGFLFGPGALAVLPAIQPVPVYSYSFATPIMLAADEQEIKATPAPEAGSLLLPAASEDEREEKKCMTVCSRWGEECMFINRGAGGTSKKCRRACKSFAEECF